jgi:hypothetical protein
MAADVKIDIAAEFTGKKAFRQAETSTQKLTSGVKKLAGAIGLAYGTTQIIAFGKASMKAAAADQKAQQQLALALKNVGLGRDAATSEAYIQRLQSEFGIVDDKLRPSYQTLAIATRDSAEAQRLMGIALDVSAANSLDLGAVTKALSRAFLGNNTALSRLGVGISKADLKSKSFKEITDQLSATFAGSATAAANSYQGSMDKLAVATENFKESIGVGLIEALNILNGEQGIAKTTSEIDKLGIKLQNATIGAAYFVNELKKIPGGSLLTSLLGKTFGDPLGIKSLINAFEDLKQEPRPFSTPMTISGQVQIRQQAQITRLTQQQATAQAKITKDKKLQQAIDKANLALLKGEEIFDMDKIQVAAALTNQAEQLGKATTASQALQIANDTARLNVKQSILALEDAIASKDEAAIVAATNKLNADLKVLGALTGQSIKLSDIKSILESLKPVDLINLANLDAAIAKMMELLKLQGTKTLTPTQGNTSVPSAVSTPSAISSPTAIAELMTGIGSNLKEFTILTDGIANSFQKIEDVGAFNALTNMYAGGAINPFNAGSFRMAEGGSTFSSGAVGSRDINITVNAGVGDPEAIARAVEDVIRQSYQRGTSSTGLLTL